ncbi:hypothetical protein JL722_12265 [Aureococcus anophagefferens]|nr:hypothetical protein JL722_12265 [Aureococcus anophagefferens]
MGAQKKRVVTRSSALLDDAPKPRGGGLLDITGVGGGAAASGGASPVSAVSSAPADGGGAHAPGSADEQEAAFRELNALQESNPEAFAQMMAAALASRAPGFVLKTTAKPAAPEGMAAAGEVKSVKYFINICAHEAVGVPKQNPCEDNKKDPASPRTASSTKVLADADEDKTGAQRDFLCQLAMTYVEQKYKLAMDRKYKLPRLKYKGDPEANAQWVRDASKRAGVEEATAGDKWKAARAKATMARPARAQVWYAPTSTAPLAKAPATPEEGPDAWPVVLLPRGPRGGFSKLPHDADRPYAVVARLSLPRSPGSADLPERQGRRVGLRRQAGDATPRREPAAPADKYRLRKPAPAPAASAPGSALEKPPPGASAHELAYAAAHAADVAARAADNSGEGEGGAFAEDKFHKADILSQHYINQRESTVKEKKENAEKERKENAKDPNIEYLDMDDFRPGGKFAPSDGNPAPLPPKKPAEPEKPPPPPVTAAPLVDQPGAAVALESSLWAELL